MKKIFLASLVYFISAFANPFVCSADWVAPSIKAEAGYHYDLRQVDKHYYILRLEDNFMYEDALSSVNLISNVFYEAHKNSERNLWERKTLGGSVGISLWEWLSISQSLQNSWYKEDIAEYCFIEKEDMLETATKLMFEHKFIDSDKFSLSGFVANEYICRLDKKEVLRNELTVGFKIPFLKYFESKVNWRHIDRVHFFDSDSLEGAVSINF